MPARISVEHNPNSSQAVKEKLKPSGWCEAPERTQPNRPSACIFLAQMNAGRTACVKDGVLRIKSECTLADLVGCVASLVDASACFIFLFLPTIPAITGRVYILVLDPIACIIVYWALYRRLQDTRPIWAELGFYLLILGTLFLACQNVLGESASLNLVTLDYATATWFDILLELLVTSTLPVGLAIYAWLIATSPPLRRWLGVMMGVQAVLLFIALGSFIFPHLSDFVSSQLFTVYAIILSVAKAVWFLWPVKRKPDSY